MNTEKPFYESVDLPESSTNFYKHAFFLRNFFQAPYLFEERMKEIEQEVVSQLPVLENDIQEIECYEPEEMSINTLKEKFAQDIRPIVIRGYAKDHACVRDWTPEYFKENYGQFKVFFTSTEKILNDDNILLSEFIDSVISGNKNRAYIENLSDIFNVFPELHDQIGLDKVGQYLGDYASYHRIAQFFLGGRGTGAVYHCANELNCFLNIYGEKQWTFVHPKYASAMYTSMFNKGFFVGSFVKHNAPKGFLEAQFPLYNRIPKLRIILKPGDMLINPPWWWHAIDNLSPVTIAVATRWKILTDHIHQNSFYEFVQSFRADRLDIFRKKFADGEVVVSDKQIRKNYVSYSEMGWKAS